MVVQDQPCPPFVRIRRPNNRAPVSRATSRRRVRASFSHPKNEGFRSERARSVRNTLPPRRSPDSLRIPEGLLDKSHVMERRRNVMHREEAGRRASGDRRLVCTRWCSPGRRRMRRVTGTTTTPCPRKRREVLLPGDQRTRSAISRTKMGNEEMSATFRPRGKDVAAADWRSPRNLTGRTC